MREALLYDVGDLRIVDSPKPEIDSYEVLVGVKCCAVCPTDARKFKTGNHGVMEWPFNLGHEWAGDIVEVGEKLQDRFSVGTRVHGTQYGGYAEYIRMGSTRSPKDPAAGVDMLFELPEGVSYEEGTFAEPLADCIHAIQNRARVGLGDWLVVVGAGQMGLQQIMVAQAMGVRVIVTELLEDRVELARQFGADEVVNPANDDAVEQVKEITGGGADAVVLTVGAPAAVEPALRMVKTHGRVVLFGGFVHGSEVTFDPNVIHYGEVSLVGSEWVGMPPHSSLGLYDLALSLIATGQVPVRELITHRYRLEELEAALEMVASHEALKAVVNFD